MDDWLGVGEAVTAVVALAVLPAGILTGLFVGVTAAVAVVAVGYLFVLPATAVVLSALGLFATEPEDWENGEPPVTEPTASEADAPSNDADPLADLRERYARGDIDDVEFERKLDRLIQTEDVDVPPEVSLDRTDDESDSEDRESAFEE